MIKEGLSQVKEQFANEETKKAISEVASLYADVIKEFMPVIVELYQHEAFQPLFEMQAKQIAKYIYAPQSSAVVEGVNDEAI